MIPSSIAKSATADAPHDCPREARRDAIVAAARHAFFTQGYGSTAMSAIAAAVGGSKTTLWSYFPSKEALFAAVVDDFVDRYGKDMALPIDQTLPLPEALRAFALRLMTIVLNHDILDLHRLVMGEASRFPELSALFYERGPKRGRALLEVYLKQAMADGVIRSDDPARATREFVHLCQAGCYQKALLGLSTNPTAAEIAKDIDWGIETFVRAWSPDADSQKR